MPFFQVAATVIPVLFLAMLFQARTLHEVWQEEGSYWMVIVAVAFAAVAIAAESDALQVVARGYGSVQDEKDIATWLFALAALVLLGPYWAEVKSVGKYRTEHRKRDWKAAFYLAYFALWTVAGTWLSARIK